MDTSDIHNRLISLIEKPLSDKDIPLLLAISDPLLVDLLFEKLEEKKHEFSKEEYHHTMQVLESARKNVAEAQRKYTKTMEESTKHFLNTYFSDSKNQKELEEVSSIISQY